jgi:hypothetical protein
LTDILFRLWKSAGDLKFKKESDILQVILVVMVQIVIFGQEPSTSSGSTIDSSLSQKCNPSTISRATHCPHDHELHRRRLQLPLHSPLPLLRHWHLLRPRHLLRRGHVLHLHPLPLRHLLHHRVANLVHQMLDHQHLLHLRHLGRLRGVRGGERECGVCVCVCEG